MMAKSRRAWLGYGRALVIPMVKGLSPYYKEGIASLKAPGELRVSKMVAHTFWTNVLETSLPFPLLFS